MKRSSQIFVCPECKAITIRRLRLTEKKPKCCGKTMKKVKRDQSGGEVYR